MVFPKFYLVKFQFDILFTLHYCKKNDIFVA